MTKIGFLIFVFVGGCDKGTSSAADLAMGADLASARDLASGGGGDLAAVTPTCEPAFGAAQACGGSVLGAWSYRAGCSDQDLFAEARALCPALAVANQTIAASGTLTFASTTFDRVGTASVSADLTVPASCAAAAGGCAGVKSAIESSRAGTTATCSAAAAGACACATTVPIGSNDSGPYVVVGSQITTDPGTASARSFHLCAQPGSLVYRGMNADADGKVTFVLTR